MRLLGDSEGLTCGALAAAALLWLAAPAAAAEMRCGWLDNPTPANWWLVDKDGEWTLSVQGGYQADGVEDMPPMSDGEYVRTNGSYGYTCACLTVEVNREEMRIAKLVAGKKRPLASCRKDSALPKR